MYGCEIWSLILKEEHRLRVFESRVLRKIFGPRREQESGENYIIRILMICNRHQLLFGDQIENNETDDQACSTYGEK